MNDAQLNTLTLSLIASLLMSGIAAAAWIKSWFNARATTMPQQRKLELDQQNLELEKLARDNEATKTELERARQDAANASAIRDVMTEMFRRNRELDDRFNTMRDNYDARMTELTDKLDSTEEALSAAQSSITTLTNQRGERDRQIDQLRSEFVKIQGELNALKLENSQLRETNQAQKKELDNRDLTIADLNRQLRDVRGELEKLQKRVENVEGHAPTIAIVPTPTEQDEPKIA